MKKMIFSAALLLSALLLATAASADPGPDGWRTTLSDAAAKKAVFDYTNNVVHCVWASETPKIGDALPANVPFHFVLAGEEFSVSNVQDILNATCKAIPEPLHERLIQAHLLGPTLQWFVRFIRCNSTRPDDYLKAANHPSTFREADFNPTNLPLFASQLRAQDIPPAVSLEIVEEMYRKNTPATPADAGVDYPGNLPETTFATPFGISMVLRAPQAIRQFRLQAKAWPNANQKVTFHWQPLTRGVGIGDWHQRKFRKSGYGLVWVDLRALKPGQRADVAVFAKSANGLWGAPSIISFYLSPYEKRTYANNKEIRGIQYLPEAQTPPPFDIDGICPRAHWTDYYQGTEKKQILALSRLLPGATNAVEISNCGEVVLEHHPNGTAKTTKKLRYFIRDGLLRFEETGESVSHKIDDFKPRLRGE